VATRVYTTSTHARSEMKTFGSLWAARRGVSACLHRGTRGRSRRSTCRRGPRGAQVRSPWGRRSARWHRRGASNGFCIRYCARIPTDTQVLLRGWVCYFAILGNRSAEVTVCTFSSWSLNSGGIRRACTCGAHCIELVMVL
jgi:hypothetical protein